MPDGGQETRVRRAYAEHFGGEPEVLVRAPGRATLLGAHIDYSDGPILAVALDRAVWLAASRRGDQRLRAVALDLEEKAEFAVTTEEAPAAWRAYPWAVAQALRRAGPAPPGLDVVYGGNLPRGAGVSSSAAVEVAFLLAWRRLGGLDFDDLEAARLARRAENDFLGVASGLMDPFVSLHGAAHQAVLLDCRDLSFRRLPLPQDAVLLLADSGVRRQLGEASESGFNDRRQECREAVEILRRVLPQEGPRLRNLRDLSWEAFELHSHHLPRVLRRRVRHGLEEMERVWVGARALEAGDMETFGALMRRSHLSSRDFYEVSLPELDLPAATAWATPGCWGARLSGGGFGGCVSVLVEEGAVEGVRASIQAAFQGAFDRIPPVHLCRIAAGANV
jgi:galactokinase